MLGGGVFVTQNKKLPGSYMNFVNASRASTNIGDRGVVAIALSVPTYSGVVLELNKENFNGYIPITESLTDDGKQMAYDLANALVNEIFCHANKVYLYCLGDGDTTHINALQALEGYEFNTIALVDDTETIQDKYVDKVKVWRDQLGKKCQVVLFNTRSINHEGIINVVTPVAKIAGFSGEAIAGSLVAWVAGAMAGCKINESCTNMLYDGACELTEVNKSQSELEQCIENGQIVFHTVYGEIRLLEDINTLKDFTAEKGEDFKYNQTIRVADQIANDIAKLFNTKYLGRIPNNASGRVSLWADIVAHHRELEAIGAIENFDATLLTVEQGNNKKSVVVNDVISVVNAMSQLYMTVVIQ